MKIEITGAVRRADNLINNTLALFSHILDLSPDSDYHPLASI